MNEDLGFTDHRIPFLHEGRCRSCTQWYRENVETIAQFGEPFSLGIIQSYHDDNHHS